MAQAFDVAVIGAGPGGYIAGIRAAQLGYKVVIVDPWSNAKGAPAPGGTCTNIGCIPSKALLQSSEHFEHAGHSFAAHGIKVGKLELDLPQMIKRKQEVVDQNNQGLLFLFRKNKMTFIHGLAAFTGKTDGGYEFSVKLSKDGKDDSFTATHVIVATGSNARALPIAPFDEEKVLSNDGALRIGAVPARLAVIGAGVIGLEMGSVWRRLCAQVTILEALPTFLGAVDQQIAKEAHKALTKQGLAIELGVKIDSVDTSGKGVKISYASDKGEAKVLEADKLIVSIGRVPNTIGLNAEAVGLKLDERGFVIVDDECRTSLANVWAIGDVVRGPMLAHKAEEEGSAVAERIAGQHPHVNFNTVPWVIYTSPEIAWVGRTEEQLKKDGVEYKVGTFPFMANGRARAIGDTTGLVKVISDATSDEILGMHMVGPGVSELIAEAVVAMEFRASSEDIGMICHAHPSLSEATKEASLAVLGRALSF
ncbi:dihydrolipoyl dehydrogenase [soil metagenome]